MTSQVYKFRVYCNEEKTYHIVWSDEEPTVCPHNDSHTIDTSATVILEKLNKNEVQIVEEQIPTGGRFRVYGQKIIIQPNTTEITEVSFPYPISVMTARLKTKDNSEGDIFGVEIAPKTTVGTITANTEVGSNLINVSKSVIDNIFVGALLYLTNGSIINSLGNVIEINKSNNTIRCENNISDVFSVTDPTFVQMTISFANMLELGDSDMYTFGGSKIGGSYIPANIKSHFIYENKSSTDVKTVYVYVEHLY